MPTIEGEIPTACVTQPDTDDFDAILALHGLGREFQQAIGVHTANNPAAVMAQITKEEESRVLDLTISLCTLGTKPDLTSDDIKKQEVLLGTQLHCMTMQTGERYLENINVPFQTVADSIKIDVSDKVAVEKNIAICEKYGLTPLARVLKHKLDH